VNETTTSDAVLARLEALTARLDEQAAEIAALKAENARLTAARPSEPPLAAEPSRARPQVGRRPSGAGILKRRGLLAGAAAMLGAGLAKLGDSGRVEATSGTPTVQGTLVLGASDINGASNTATTPTVLRVLTANQVGLGVAAEGIGPGTASLSIGDAIVGFSRSGSVFGEPSAAIRGRGFAGTPDNGTFGVIGNTESAIVDTSGVKGKAGSGPTNGVWGENLSTDNRASGVKGQIRGSGAGVRGEVTGAASNAGSGVVGVAAGCDFGNANAVGVGGSGRNADGLTGTRTGVVGITGQGIGVEGWGMRSGTGVRGSSNFGGGPDFSGSGIGVEGRSGTGTGVHGESTSSIGVHGKSRDNAGVFAQGPIGVYAAGTGVAGVFGGSSGGFGFWGNSATSAGIYGTSTSGPGVRAESTNAFGLHAKAPVYAGVFEGNVFVTGRVIAQGGVGASATTPTRMLAEDVGEATLVNGKATVALDPSFAEEVKGGRYQVFVTPHDASGRPLAVVARRRDGFDVQELAGGATDAGTTSGRGSNAGFSYRVVAKLTGPAGPRPAPLAPPDLTTIKPAPPLPEPPKAPEPSGASEERRQR